MCRTVLGCALDWPLILAPTGMTRLFHKDGEVGVAKVAGQSGAGYTLSTMATASIEEIAAIPGGPKIFQLYLLNDEARSEEHTSELQSLMRTSSAVFCLKKKHTTQQSTKQLTTS